MNENAQGRIDILIQRLADELGNRIHAQTRIDIRDAIKEAAEKLIDDMKIPRTEITANDVARAVLGLSDRTRPARRLRRVR